MARDKLRGLVLSAVELAQLTNWNSSVIDDYLYISNERKLEDIPTDFTTGSVIFVDNGFLNEDVNFIWDTDNNVLIVSSVAIENEGLKLEDLGGDNFLILKPNTDFTADRTLSLTIGDSDREIILLGNPTLDDWFDQEVKTTSDVTHRSLTLDFAQFVIDADPDLTSEGQVQWDEADHALSYVSGLGNVVQIGQETWGIGVNKTGGTATDGKAVYFSGVQGLRPTYNYADARDGDKVSLVGVVTAPTENNQEGPVTTFGLVRGLDTSAWAPGTKLYVAADATGNLTSTPPSTPNFRVLVANVVSQNVAQGTIFVNPRIDFGNGITFDSLDINNDLTVGGNLFVAEYIQIEEQSTDPTDPAEGRAIFWMSDGTDTGDDGDLLYKEQSGAVIEQGSLKWKDFVPSSITLTAGTLVTGTVTDVQTMFTETTTGVYQVQELAATPGFDIRFNFTNIDRYPRAFVVRYRYEGFATHFVGVDLYNYTTMVFDQAHIFTTTSGFYENLTKFIPVAQWDDYVDGSGNAVIRFYHYTAGNAAHNMYIDYVGLTSSLQGVI